jgi:phosphopantothenoylcysteine decarboxylase/phosphopantothenate--cysteine ligase
LLKGKHILVGVTGSIAAYKAAMLVRMLVREGAEVKVIMTDTAKKFITPLTMATLSKNPVLAEFYNPENGDWNSHVSLGLWTDLYLIAPASANTMAAMANGIAGNLLLTTYLSARSLVAVAPAMDLDMYRHPATQNNLRVLRERGVHVIEPACGELASGLEGKGRMEEPEKIVSYVKSLFPKKSGLKGKKVLITAGPTMEAIDPVRYITNHSSGKMGYALALECADRGAGVTLVSGPTHIEICNKAVKKFEVTSAEEMFRTTVQEYEKGADITILSAAVADFTPAIYEGRKIKREKQDYQLLLSPTKDIAEELGRRKKSGTLLIGFALETDNEIANARLKLEKKNLDAIVLNSLNEKGAGFGSDTNKIYIINREVSVQEYPVKEKAEVASDIMDYVEKVLSCSSH